jgi:hypothetical protein
MGDIWRMILWWCHLTGEGVKSSPGKPGGPDHSNLWRAIMKVINDSPESWEIEAEVRLRKLLAEARAEIKVNKSEISSLKKMVKKQTGEIEELKRESAMLKTFIDSGEFIGDRIKS